MKKKICMLLAGTMLAGSLGTTGFAQEETTTTEPMELTMYFPVSVGGGPDALIDDLCAQFWGFKVVVKNLPVASTTLNSTVSHSRPCARWTVRLTSCG